MTNAIFKEKIRNLEAEIVLLRRAVTKEPDFYIDEKNWGKIRPMMKKIRAKVFKKTYA